MKKTIAYPLIALLILSLIACGVLFMDRQSLKLRLQTAEEQMTAAQDEVSALVAEKEQWLQDKQAVGKTIGTVKTVLIDTLKELDEVTDVFGGEQTPAPKEAAPTPAPTETPRATGEPSPTPVANREPAATEQAKETEVPKAAEKATEQAGEKAAETEKAPAEKTAAFTPAPTVTAAPTTKK